MRNIEACLSHKSDEWATPLKLYNRFMINGYFDPCPMNHDFDGLCIPWKAKTFVNPPYSCIDKWVDKALTELSNGNVIVMLLPARTDTQWFKKLFLNGHCRITFVEGRLKLNDLNSAPFPSMFVTLDRRFVEYGFFKSIQYMTKRDLEKFIQGY